MRIVHIITNLETGGAEMMLKRLVAAQQVDSRLSPAVLSLRNHGTVGPQIEALGVPVEAFGMNSPAAVARRLPALTRRIRALKPDIVQTWMYHGDLIGGIAARRAGVRNIIWGIRTADVSAAIGTPRTTMWIRAACAKLSRSLPASIVYVAETARVIHERIGYDPSKSVVIRNGYEIPALEAVAAARARCRAELGLGEDQLLIGTAGRFDPVKGYHGFIQAAGAIAREHPDVRFQMVGRELDRDNTELGQWLQASGASDRFSLMGERRDVRDWLAAMEVFVINSLVEGFPNIVAEAMSAAVPCIVTDAGDAAMLVQDTGIVIEPGDTQALIEAMRRMIGERPEQRRTLGMRARARVTSEFSMAAVAAQYQRLYDELLRPTSGSDDRERAA